MLPRDDTLYLRRNRLSAERRGQIRGCGVMKPEDRRRSRLASRTRENHTVEVGVVEKLGAPLGDVNG